MTKDTPGTNHPDARGKPAPESRPESREDRLRAALRANLLRRKAQARGRAALDAQEGQEDE